MSPKLKPVSEQTVVITGASSGIGLATALEFARKGARVVLASRDDGDIETAADRVRAEGADVLTVAVDVADRLGVDYVVQQTAERFGGFDTWVNNAGTSAYGALKDLPEEDARQIFETNYWGVVHGSLVAAEHFRTRGGAYAGALINVGSVLSDRAVPLQGHYSASKHAVRGFTDALRMELEKEGVAAQVTLIKPSAINTPYPEHAGSYMDQAPSLPPPVYEPEVVARTILACAEKPYREISVGIGGLMISAMGKLLPRATDLYMEATQFDQQKRDDRPARQDAGGLQDPIPNEGAHVHGDSPHRAKKSSLYTWLQLNPLAAAGAALAVGLGLTLATRDGSDD